MSRRGQPGLRLILLVAVRETDDEHVFPGHLNRYASVGRPKSTICPTGPPTGSLHRID
jgi:hypothetical protein